MLLALAFEPIFVYAAGGLCLLVTVARLLIGWAMDSS
jgi:hypothetical protein